jgi:peptidoglycan/LPS O-acetylase OafA/YrhL
MRLKQPETSYIPALDGVRAIAVTAVLLYHLSYGHLSGAFLGVDVFFVLSGFLISRLLIDEYDRTRDIGFRRFYLRRVFRLYPALVAAVLLSGLLWPLITPPRLGEEGWLRTVPPILLYYANAVPGHLGNMEPTWSLAVEEQFYIVWPIVLWLLLRNGRTWILVAFPIVVGVASALHRISAIQSHPLPDVYVSTLARLDPLMVGALIAILFARTSYRSSPRTQTIGVAVGLLACAAAFLLGSITNPSTYRLFSAMALAAGVLVAAVVQPRPRNVIDTILGSAPLTWVGKRSYGIYLYHMPVAMAVASFRHSSRPKDILLMMAAQLVLIFAISALSYRFVEQPFLRLNARLRRSHSEGSAGSEVRGAA